MNDCDAWKKYPQHRKWFNKLYVADIFGYDCGPSGIAPNRSDEYIVRPIYNLSGMGLGASIKYIEKGDCNKVPPSYFWCEVFKGDQYSITYKKTDGEWKPISSFKGVNYKENLWKFSHWQRSNNYIDLPKELSDFSDVDVLNVEYIKDNPFEVHLRHTPDPDYDIFVPVWSGEEDIIYKYKLLGYEFVSSYEDADGFLESPRLGFMIKNY